MPIPFTASHAHLDSITSLPRHDSSRPSRASSANAATGTNSNSSHGMNNVMSVHGRMHSSLEPSATRRWNRLQRRSPMDSPSHHSPRTRYLSSFAPNNHPNSRTERQYQTQQQQHRREHDAGSTQHHQQPSQLHDFVVSRHGRLSPPSLRQLPADDALGQAHGQDSNTSFLPSHLPSTNHTVASMGPVRMESSEPRERFFSYNNSPTQYRPIPSSFSSRPLVPSTSSLTLPSSSLSPSSSSATAIDPPTPTVAPGGPIMRNRVAVGTHPPPVSSTPHVTDHRDGHQDAHSATNGSVSSSSVSVPSRDQVDDRIHFRLLNDIFFSAPSRQGAVAMTPTDHEELQYLQDDMHSDEDDDIFMENETETEAFGGSSRHVMFTDQGHEFASVRFTLSSRQDLMEEEGGHMHGTTRDSEDDDEDDEDEDDDGVDQVVEGHRQQFMSETRSFVPASPTSPSPSTLHPPQHAQLSPRSAAALTTMFSMGRSSWPQPLMPSSITPSLISLSQQRARSEYDNNPYFRRPAPMRASGMGESAPSDSRSPLLRRSSIHESQYRGGGGGGGGSFTSVFRPRATSSGHIPLEVTRHATTQTFSNSHPSTDSGTCHESYAPDSTEARGDIWPLKFEMYFADGGEFNAAHSVENVLKNDASVYCSRRSANINICLKLAEPNSQTFVLTQFKAKAPSTGFTAPCKEGLIFVSHEPIPLEKTAFFDNMTRERYEEYMEEVKRGSSYNDMLERIGPNPDALVPAAFFQMDGSDESCTLDFTPNRSGRYVLIKLLRSRCANSMQRPENIDLQYLGLFGFTGARSFASGGLL